MKKILVTGAKGQLGADCSQLLEPDVVLIKTDIDQVDLSDAREAERFLSITNPDVIINCAAYTAVDACETDPLCWNANRDLPSHLAVWTARHDRYMIHVSTDYVFDGKRALFESWTEEDTPHPVSEYGRSKLAGEEAIMASGCRHAIVRTAWLYGMHGNNFLKTMLRLSMQHPDKQLKVVNDQFGSPTWSKTLAAQIIEVMKKEAQGVFHASSEGYCSWCELAIAFLEEMGVDHKIEPCTSDEYPTPTERPVNSILENQHLKNMKLNLFGNWQEELSRFVNEYRELLLEEAVS